MTRIYTDGSCLGNPGAGGWAAIIVDEHNQREELFGGEAHTTNNRMELTAAIRALEKIPAGTSVELFTDSSYLKNAFTKGWLAKWKSADGKMDAEDLLSEAFEYVCQRSLTSTSSSLWKDSATSLGTIVREPDADGFFVMRPRYEDEDHLCVLLRKKESPSLYRGMLV